MVFDFKTPEAGRKYLKLLFRLDGRQKCAEEPDKWTENWTSRPIPEEVAERMCAGCPFLEECRDYALEAGEDKGIWGGTTPDMRRKINDS